MTTGPFDVYREDLDRARSALRTLVPELPEAGQEPGAAAVVQAQLWYRDPASTSSQTTSLSDAIEFVVQP